MRLDSELTPSPDSPRRLIFSSSSSTFFPSAVANHLTLRPPGERVRLEGRSFSPRRDATLRLALFSRRISLIFRLLFPVLRINVAVRAAPVSRILANDRQDDRDEKRHEKRETIYLFSVLSVFSLRSYRARLEDSGETYRVSKIRPLE